MLAGFTFSLPKKKRRIIEMTLTTQQSEWRQLTGESMPIAIYNMDSAAIERRLKLLRNRRDNDLFFVPRDFLETISDEPESSLQDWDNHDNKLGS